MMFMQLPIELLDKIIQHTLPEGFESVALTCVREARDKGVVVVVHRFPNEQTFLWDGEP